MSTSSIPAGKKRSAVLAMPRQEVADIAGKQRSSSSDQLKEDQDEEEDEERKMQRLNPYTSPLVLLVGLLRERLQSARPTVLEMPVNAGVSGQRRLTLRIDATAVSDAGVRAEVDAFCARYKIPDGRWLLRQALSRLRPEATDVLGR